MSLYTRCDKCGAEIELPAFEGDGVFSRDYPHRCETRPFCNCYERRNTTAWTCPLHGSKP